MGLRESVRISLSFTFFILTTVILLSGCKDDNSANGTIAETLGIGSYDVTIDSDSVFRILVNDKKNVNMGSIFMFADEDTGALFSEYTSVDGQSAALYSEVFEDREQGTATVRRTLFVGNLWLEVEITNPNSESEEGAETVTFTAGMLDDMLPPSIGQTRPDGTSIVATVTTAMNGTQRVEDKDLQTWMWDMGLRPVLNSAEAAYLMGVHSDMDLMNQIASVMDGDGSEESTWDGPDFVVAQKALTDSQSCGALSAYKLATSGAKAFKSCGKCAAKLSGAVAGTATTGGLATASFLLFAAKDCYKCMKKGDQLSSKAAKCWYCCWGPNTQQADKTDAICRDNYSCPGGREAKATEDAYFCDCFCDDDECNNYCEGLISGSGGSHKCDSNRGRCICDWDPETYCQANHADRYCTGAKKNSTGGFSCPQAVCGDKNWDVGCVNSALDEQCDPKAIGSGNCDSSFETCGQNCECKMSDQDEPSPIDCRETCFDSELGVINHNCMNECCCEGADVCGWGGDGLCDCNGENYWDTCDCNPSDNCEDTIVDPDTDGGGSAKGSFNITLTYVNPRFDNRGIVISGDLNSRPSGGATSGGGASGHLFDSPDDFNGLYVEYAISGAALDEPTDYTDGNTFFPERAFTGTLTGPDLRVTGTVTYDSDASYGTDYGDFYGTLSVSVTVGSDTETYDLVQGPGESAWSGLSYDVSVPIP